MATLTKTKDGFEIRNHGKLITITNLEVIEVAFCIKFIDKDTNERTYVREKSLKCYDVNGDLTPLKDLI